MLVILFDFDKSAYYFVQMYTLGFFMYKKGLFKTIEFNTTI